MLRSGILVDVAAHAETGQRFHFVRAGDRPAEDHQRPVLVGLADRTYQLDALPLGQPKIEQHEIDRWHMVAQDGEQLRAGSCAHGAVPGVLQRGSETVTYEFCVVGNGHRLHDHGAGCGHHGSLSGPALQCDRVRCPGTSDPDIIAF